MKHENNDILQTQIQVQNSPITENTASNSAATHDGVVSRRRKVSWYDFIVIVFIFLLSQVLGVLFVGAMGVESPSNELLNSELLEEREDALRELAAVNAVNFFCAMFISVILTIAYLRLRRIRVNVKFFSKGWANPSRLLMGYVLLWCLSLTAEPLTELLPSQSVVIGSGFWLLVTTVVLAPFFEELLFRGYILGAVRSRYGIMAAWLLSSLLFGAVHGVPASIVSAALSGLVLGYYYIRYNSLIQVIMLHAMNNLTVCFMMSLGVAEKSISEIVSNDTIYWTIYAVSVIVSVVALCIMFRHLQMRKKINISAKQ